jgi:hypothetical protein
MRAIRLGLHFDEALFAATGLHEHCEARAWAKKKFLTAAV